MTDVADHGGSAATPRSQVADKSGGAAGRVLRSTARMAGALFLAIGLAALIATALLAWRGTPQAAVAQFVVLRPVFIGMQLLALGLLWHFWARAIAFVTRRHSLSQHAMSVLVASRPRIFILLGLCEGLQVLRAFSS